MKKETYTFAQILLALYQKYSYNQTLLKLLKQYIEVTPNKKISDINFIPQFELYDQLPNDRLVYHDERIRLEITEEINLLKRIKEEFSRLSTINMELTSYDITQWLRKLYYNIERDKNGDYQIKFKVNGEITSINPQISIINQSKFNELVDKIINSELMSIQRQAYNANRMIGGWDFFMDAYYIGLFGPENKQFIRDIRQKVEFLPQKNMVIISSPGTNKNLTDLLYEPIPNFCFSENARKIIERDLPIRGEIILESDQVEPYGKNKFNIEQYDNKIKLVKIKTR